MLPELFRTRPIARRYQPQYRHPFSWFDQMNELLDAGGDSSSLLSIDLEEKEDSYQVTADVPGISRNDIDISIDESDLTLSVERKEVNEQKEKNYTRRERIYGSAVRTVHLPLADSNGDIDATLQNGVLVVTVPKRENSRSRHVAVK